MEIGELSFSALQGAVPHATLRKHEPNLALRSRLGRDVLHGGVWVGFQLVDTVCRNTNY